MKNSILVIEDEEDIAELLKFNLSAQGYKVRTAGNGEEGLKAARESEPDLVLLDVMLPGVDGLEICRRLKDPSGHPGVPVIMVTARGGEQDIVKGLELGADDYITKPFSPKVMLARVAAVLRRSETAPRDGGVAAKTGKASQKAGEEGALEIYELVIHPGRHLATIGGTRLDLTPSEFKILRFLAQRPGWVFTRSQIVDAVRGENYAVTERSIDVQMVGLRKKLGKYEDYVETVRGVGYRFKDSEGT